KGNAVLFEGIQRLVRQGVSLLFVRGESGRMANPIDRGISFFEDSCNRCCYLRSDTITGYEYDIMHKNLLIELISQFSLMKPKIQRIAFIITIENGRDWRAPQSMIGRRCLVPASLFLDLLVDIILTGPDKQEAKKNDCHFNTMGIKGSRISGADVFDRCYEHYHQQQDETGGKEKSEH